MLSKLDKFNQVLIITCMPVSLKGVTYNCSLFIFNGAVVLIKPKLYLADDGNYRESRWFTPWKAGTKLFKFTLPSDVQLIAT